MRQKLIPLTVALFMAFGTLGRAQAPPTPSPSPTPPAGTPTFPAEVELVTVDVVVADKKGNALSGLKKEDFILIEDGAAQDVVSFEAVTVPPLPPPAAAGGAERPVVRPRVSTNTGAEVRTSRTFVIVFDDVNLTHPQAYRAKNAIAEFLKTGVREGDRVTLVATGGGVWWSAKMTSGRDELIALLKRLEGRRILDLSPHERMSDYEALRIHVYHDTNVGQRVERRFESTGMLQRYQAESEDQRQPGTSHPLVEGRAREIYEQAVTRNRITLNVVERVLGALEPTKGRKSMILVSEGFIYDPQIEEFKQVIGASRRANVAIYFVDTRGLQGMAPGFAAEFGPPIDSRDIGPTLGDMTMEAEGAESIAADSGGFTVRNTNDLAKGIQRIVDESQSYYLLGYNPKVSVRDGKFRKIEVKVNRKGLQVRARKGYYSPQEGKPERKTKPGHADPDLQQALDSPFDVEGVPLRMAAYVFEETLLGKARVLTTADVDVKNLGFEEKEGRFLDTLDMLLVVAHRETEEYYRYDQKYELKLSPPTREKYAKTWFPLVTGQGSFPEFELPPGGYQAKLVVRDKNTGKIGTVIHEFDVPDLADLRVSSPIVTDTVLPARSERESRPRPILLVRRDFPAGAVLLCQFEVYGAARDKATGMPRVTQGYALYGLDGSLQRRADATQITPTSLGAVSRMMWIPLEGLEPGRYELVLSFRDEVAGKIKELREPFTIEAAPAAATASH